MHVANGRNRCRFTLMYRRYLAIKRELPGQAERLVTKMEQWERPWQPLAGAVS